MKLTPKQMIALVLLVAAPVAVFGAMGRTAGSFSVGASGTASYSIPLWTPPGVRGIQPQLALVYSSGGGSGLYGMGWGLAGLSTIERCNRTAAQDSGAGSPQLDANDRFCLNGNRLRLAPSTGAYGADGTVYFTEIADFSRVTSHGTGIGAGGVGPSWFSVEGKNGLSYEYGHTTDSAIPVAGTNSVRTWALNKVSDRNGNYMTFVYSNDTTNGSYRIATINYTTTSSTTANYQVAFTYQSRATADQIWTYEIGGKNNELNRVAYIEMKSGGSVVKSYRFTYDESPTTQRTRLKEIKECSTSISDCLLPTTIGYQDGASGWGSELTSSGTLNTTNNAYALPIDVNGDGRDDIVYPNTTTSTWYYALGNTSGTYDGPYNTAVSIGSAYQASNPIDYDSDGNMDVLIVNGANWGVMKFQSAGGAFTLVTTTIPVTVGGEGWTRTGDIDGDGRDDLIYAISAGSTWGSSDSIKYRLNSGSSFGSELTLVTFTNGGGCNPCNKLATSQPLGKLSKQFESHVRYPDFNGDGRRDFLVSIRQCLPEGVPGNCGQAGRPIIPIFYVVMSRANGTYGALEGVGASQAAGGWPLIGDFNGDGCSDSAATSSGTWRLQFGTCWKAGDPAVLSVPQVNTGSSAGVDARAMDWDGDGRDDIVSSSGGNWGYARSTGATLGAWTTLSIPYVSTSPLYVTDSNGDGQSDFLYANGSSVPATRPHSGVLPDLATSFTDGYGVNASPTYTSIAMGSYTKGSGAVYPEQDLQVPLYVVSQASASNGVGGTYAKTYAYSGARFNRQGRGFEGMQSRTVTDSRANALITKTFYQTGPFPLSGAVDYEDVYQSNGTTLVSHSDYTNASTTLDTTANNQRYFVSVAAAMVEQREVGGTKNGLLVTTSSTSYTYDSYGNATTVAMTTTDNDSTSPYVGLSWGSTTVYTITPSDGSNWCLGLPTQVAVTNTAPGVLAITRTTGITPDYVKCRATQKVTEPLSGTYAVTEVYGFDGFGNVNSTTITGVGMAARSTLTNWGTTGQFPNTLTNPLSQTTTNGYDLNLGLLTSVTDPNGVVTSTEYDAFGRMFRETRPDGTKTEWVYSDCAVSGCVNSNNKVTVTATVKNVGGGTRTDGITYLDRFERVLLTSQRMLSGAYDRNEAIYDIFGRQAQQSIPCTWVSCAAYWTTISYDAVGRPTQIQRPISASNSTLQTTTIAYAGRATTVTDPQGKQSVKITTVAGTVGRSQDHNNYYQNFTYDAFGSLLSVTDSLSNSLFSATYDYGVGPFKRTMTDADLGARSSIYNALGELTNWSDAKGQSFSSTYDALSRPLVRTEPDLTTTWTWGTSAASHNIGALQSVSAGSYQESYAYDSIGRLSGQSVVIPSDATYTFDYAYNSTTGLLDTLTYPTSTASYRLKVQYSYQNGILQGLSDFNAPTTIYWTANATNPRGQVTQETLGNGVITSRAFDAVTGWLGSQQSGVGGGASLQNESYLQDLAGNVTQRQNNNVGLTENFFYDNLYRLDHSTLGGVQNLGLTYDATGNITSRTDVAGGAAWTYHASKKHAVTQAGNSSYTYSYDANGNVNARNGYTVSWMSFDHPNIINSAGESVQFAYNQNHERWRAIYTGSAGVETTYFIGGLLEKVVTAGASDYRHYILAVGAKVAVYSRTSGAINTLRYIREDHQGSVASILNNDGTTYVKESFTAFGNRRSTCTWSDKPTQGNLDKINGVSRRGYTWHTALGAMGLNDMNGRVQDAVTGRFLSPDPYVADPSITQIFNRYSYVRNNPLSYVDPTGFIDKILPIDVITVTGHRDAPNAANPGGASFYGGGHGAIGRRGEGGSNSDAGQGIDGDGMEFVKVTGHNNKNGVAPGMQPSRWLRVRVYLCQKTVDDLLFKSGLSNKAVGYDTPIEARYLENYAFGGGNLTFSPEQFKTISYNVAQNSSNPLLVGNSPITANFNGSHSLAFGNMQGQFDTILGTTTGQFTNGRLTGIRDSYDFNPRPFGGPGRRGLDVELAVRAIKFSFDVWCPDSEPFVVTGNGP